MNEYLNIFIDKDKPYFLDKYLATETLERIKYVSQFCGCDYTKLYSPLFFYSRYFHSLVVAHMTWHFTHDKKETIASLLHDVGTPCFAHAIDYVMNDALKQESSEKDIIEIIKRDNVLLSYLKEDGITLSDLQNLSCYPILENHSPKLCTDRLDGVLHTCYIWLRTHSLNEIREVYEDIVILTNEEGYKELGFKTKKVAEKFVEMVFVYAKELQGNKDKYVMNFVAELIKKSIEKKFISLEDLYKKKESEIIKILNAHFASWKKFGEAKDIVCTDQCPKEFYVSVNAKKRNVIPLVNQNNQNFRINEISASAKETYKILENYKDTLYGYVKEIEKI